MKLLDYFLFGCGAAIILYSVLTFRALYRDQKASRKLADSWERAKGKE